MSNKQKFMYKSTLTTYLKRRIALLLLVCFVIGGTGLICAEIISYKQDAKHLAKSEVRFQVDRAMEIIAHDRAHAKEMRYEKLQSNVSKTLESLSVFYNLNKDKSEEELRQILLSAFSALTSSDNRHSYFIIDSHGEVIFGTKYSEDLALEHKFNTAVLNDDIIIQMARATKISGNGHFYYDDGRLGKNQENLTHAYVEKFAPLSWIIGSSKSIKQHNAEVQDFVRDRLDEMNYAQGLGYIFVLNFDGVELVNRTQPHLVGQNLFNATDPNGVKVVKELIKQAKQADGGYVNYLWNNPTSGRVGAKISYSKSVPDWQWVVGTGFYTDDIDFFISQEHDQLQRHMAQSIALVGIIAILSMIWAWWIWRKTGRNIAGEMDKFKNFFISAEKSYKHIDPDQFTHAEFTELAETINRMVVRRKEDESFKQALLDNLQIGIVVIDPETHTIETANPVAIEMFGAKKDEFIGTSCRHLCMSKSGACPMEGLYDEIRTKEGQLVRANGKPIPILKSVSWVTVGGRKRLLESFVDMSEREATQKKLEEALLRAERLAAEAKNATDAKSEFLSNMSHEIRTPMNGIIGMTELLMDTPVSEDQKQYVGMIQSCSEQLLGLINCILDFSKIEAGHLELEMIDFDLLDAVESVTDVLAVKAAEKNLEFSCFVSPDIPLKLCGDPGRLRQILINLAGNGIKFTHDGEVAISATMLHETETHLTIQFDVRDTGIGIPADKIGRLFKSFSQVDSSTARKYGGSGLGLAISKQLVEMMDGDINVYSVEGKGTQFTFTVQLQKQTQQDQNDTDLSDISEAHVLIVDDNETNRHILEKYLASWHVQVESADSGERALTKLKQAIDANAPVDIVIMDQHMPGMDGYDLGRAIVSNPILKNTALVMLSSAGHIKDYDNLKKTGFAAQMLKPIRRQQLHKCIAKIYTGQHNNVPVESAAESKAPQKSYEDIKILLVEDNKANQIVGTRLIEKILTIKPDIANNGREAIEILNRKDYDLVFMDCQMPELDGFETTKLIRQGETLNPDITIVAMTANAMKGDRETCIAAGMNDYISKPVSYESISQAMEKWLNITMATNS